MITPTLAQEVSRLEADLCFALSDPTRILILYSLSESTQTVNELASMLSLTQPTTSRHLKILRDRGLVNANRQGTAVHYQLVDQRLIKALDLLRGVLRDSLVRRASLVEDLD